MSGVNVLAAGAADNWKTESVNMNEFLSNALNWVDQLGPTGPAIFILIYVVACVFFIPGSALTLGAGAIFGVVKGSIFVSIGSTLGATAAFLVGRYIARDWIARKIEKNEKFAAIDQAVGAEGWKIVGLTRLSPVFPFSLLNYAYGLTRVSLRDYVMASWIGMMPGTIMYVYLGSLAGSLATLGGGTGGQARTPAQWTLYGVGLLATLAVTVYVTRIARRALSERIEPPHKKDSRETDTSGDVRRVALGGSFLAAITASLCCIGPLVAVALGAGGFAASAIFQKWRPVFLGVTFVLLALAWFLTYRKPKAACEEGSACATKPVAQWNKVVLWLATAVVLIMAAFPILSSAILRATEPSAPVAAIANGNGAVLKAKIPSMDCAACAAGIQAKLRKQKGVVTAEVNYDTKEAIVQYDAIATSPQELIAAIDETGFKAEPVVRKETP